MVQLHVEDIRVGCNKYPGCVAVGANKLTLFGAFHSIAVANLSIVKVISLLSGHPSEVTYLKWIPSVSAGFINRFFEPEIEFVSGSSDGTLLTWKFNPRSQNSWDISQVLVGHTASILGFDVSLLLLRLKSYFYSRFPYSTTSKW